MRAGFGEWAHRTDPLPSTPESALGALAPTRSDLDEGLVSSFKRKLLDEVDLHELGRLDPGQRRIRLERVLAHLVSREGVILTTRERNALIRRVVDESVGLGVLEPLLADETISEIMINGHDTIYVERFGRVERIPRRSRPRSSCCRPSTGSCPRSTVASTSRARWSTRGSLPTSGCRAAPVSTWSCRRWRSTARR